MDKLAKYRELNGQYDKAVAELKAIQALEDLKKKEIHGILEKIKEVLK